MFVTLLELLAFGLFLGGGALACISIANNYAQRYPRNRFGERTTPAADAKLKPYLTRKVSTVVGISILGLLFWIVMASGGATVVPATHIAVVENTFQGQFYTLGPGTHIWPFSSQLIPFVTKIYPYDLRRQVIEIGEPPEDTKTPLDKKTMTREYGVPSASDSPGQPIVYYRARGWASPNPEKIVELHRRYGPDYITKWVEQNWVSTIKAIQGKHQYDFLKSNRVALEDEVERALQIQLEDESGIAMVTVSQLVVVDYDYEMKINDYLASVAQLEFSRQESEQKILVNQKTQEATKIEADTKYIQTKRAAEADQAQSIARADGQAQAIQKIADAEAYQAFVKYKAEADGIALVISTLSKASSNYLEYLRVSHWNGGIPTTIVGSGGVLPIVNIPLNQTTPTLPTPIMPTTTVPITATVPTK